MSHIISLVSSYLYTVLLCLSTASVATYLLITSSLNIIVSDSSPVYEDVFSLVSCCVFITGVVMISWLISWISFIIINSLNNSVQECSSKKKKQEHSGGVRWRTVTVVVGRLSFTLLLLCLLTELTSLGFMWWTSFSLSSQFQMRGDNCFCRKQSVSRNIRRNTNLLENLSLNVSCPDDTEFSCDSLYDEMMISVGDLPVMMRKCQRLDSLQHQSQECLKYREFWFLFKILRIVLPILIVVKLPFLILNCSGGSHDDGCAGENSHHHSKSWLVVQHKVTSPFKLSSSRHSNSQTIVSKVHSSPYYGARLDPLGEEKNLGKSTELKKQNIVGFLSRQKKDQSTSRGPGSRNIDNDDISRKEDDESVDQSDQNTISTPKQAGLKTPEFDLSRVQKPVHLKNLSLNEVDLYHDHHPPPLSAPPVSSFRSTFPAVLREQMTERMEMSGARSENRSQLVMTTPTPAHYQYRQQRGFINNDHHDPNIDKYGLNKQLRQQNVGVPVTPFRISYDLEKVGKTRSKSISTSTSWRRVT